MKGNNRILKNLVYHAPWLFGDRKYLELRWLFRTGRRLDLENPLSFNEKLQWLKLYDRKQIYHTMVDKAEAKDYAASVIGREYIIPTIGVYDRVSEIPWDSLPSRFVLKCTHDSGGMIICRDKSALDIPEACRKLRSALHTNFWKRDREWPYKGVKPRIICEQYMEDPAQKNGLVDYKFFCMNGKPGFMYISEGLEDHSTARISFAGLDGTELPFKRSDYKNFGGGLPVCGHLEEMKCLASRLAEAVGNPFVRVDMYEIGGHIYFSELTFYPNGGYIPFEPAEWDRKLGDMIQLRADR